MLTYKTNTFVIVVKAFGKHLSIQQPCSAFTVPCNNIIIIHHSLITCTESIKLYSPAHTSITICFAIFHIRIQQICKYAKQGACTM